MCLWKLHWRVSVQKLLSARVIGCFCLQSCKRFFFNVADLYSLLPLKLQRASISCCELPPLPRVFLSSSSKYQSNRMFSCSVGYSEGVMGEAWKCMSTSIRGLDERTVKSIEFMLDFCCGYVDVKHLKSSIISSCANRVYIIKQIYTQGTMRN